jgi:hypothetical protein
MVAQKELPIETVRELLSYDPDTGVFVWKYRDRKWFKTERAFKIWNKRYPHEPALTAVNDRGYKYGNIFDCKYRAHRIAHAIHYGEWPKNQIDHINGVRDDNRIANLRAVTNKENSKNSSKSKNNTSGFNGVSWDKRQNRWASYIMVDGIKVHLGRFGCKLDAIAARINANKKYGFHENHGKKYA